MEPKFPTCFTLKSTKSTQVDLANTVELHMTLNTVLVPVVDQVKLGSVSLVLMSWGGYWGASNWICLTVSKSNYNVF